MTAVTWSGACQFGFLSYLLLVPNISVSASVSLDFSELKNKVSKIKVNPRGNLWATGHFMGKKSVSDAAPLEPGELRADWPEEAAKARLLREALKAAGQPEGGRCCGEPEMYRLMQILGGFTQTRGK